jgi:hypothetical protein
MYDDTLKPQRWRCSSINDMRKDFTVRPYVCIGLAREEACLLDAPPVSHQSAKEYGLAQLYEMSCLASVLGLARLDR